ncbi:MAG: hypothetical protein IKY14_04020 [Erysipelotrichaceae bacterium]|nr:hypothetical protein [Erysipelotrichaceae bacterium]
MASRNKMFERARNEKIINEIMNSDTYKQARKKEMEQAMLRGYIAFALQGCDFLELKHRYGKNGFKNFCDFLLNRVQYIIENEDYFIEMNQMFIEEHEFDVLEYLGFKIEDGEINGES